MGQLLTLYCRGRACSTLCRASSATTITGQIHLQETLISWGFFLPQVESKLQRYIVASGLGRERFGCAHRRSLSRTVFVPDAFTIVRYGDRTLLPDSSVITFSQNDICIWFSRGSRNGQKYQISRRPKACLTFVNVRVALYNIRNIGANSFFLDYSERLLIEFFNMDTNLITIDDFSRIDLRVAEVKSVENHPNADKLLILKIDAGDGIKDRQLVAGLKGHYSPAELIGKKIIIVNNLTPAVLRGVESQGMLLAAQDAGRVVILSPEKDVRPGASIR